jgi:hypothetical protein
MTLSNIQTLVQIVYNTVATLAIIAAAAWFLGRRAVARTLQITLTLKDVTMVNSTRIAIIRVQLKNIGRTRIKQKQCTFNAKVVKVRSHSDPITIVTVRGIDEVGRIDIFEHQIEIEPNEETFEDIALALNETSLFAVRVRFIPRKPIVNLRLRRKSEAWGTIAVFNADDATKNLSTPVLSTEQTTRSG